MKPGLTGIWFEGARRWHKLSGLPVLVRQSPIRLTAGEPSISSGEIRALIDTRAFEVSMDNPTWGGGLTEGRRTVELALASRLGFSPHRGPRI